MDITKSYLHFSFIKPLLNSLNLITMINDGMVPIMIDQHDSRQKRKEITTPRLFIIIFNALESCLLTRSAKIIKGKQRSYS